MLSGKIKIMNNEKIPHVLLEIFGRKSITFIILALHGASYSVY